MSFRPSGTLLICAILLAGCHKASLPTPTTQRPQEASVSEPEAANDKLLRADPTPPKKEAKKSAEPSPEPLQKLLIGPELDDPVPIDYLRVTAEQAAWAIQSEDKSVNTKYERPIQLEGVVKEIGTDESGKFLIFYTTLPVPFYLIGDAVKREAEKLKPGDKAALRSLKGVSRRD